MVERFPRDLMVTGWGAITRDDTDIESMLTRLDCPLLFANHVGCPGSTQEGFDAAAAAFPQARVVRVHDAPLSSVDFAEALREFCEGITAEVTANSQGGRPSPVDAVIRPLGEGRGSTCQAIA